MFARLAVLVIVVAVQFRPQVAGRLPSQDDGLSIEYSPLSTRVALREPIVLRLTISNRLDNAARVNLGQDRRQGFEVSVTAPEGGTKLLSLQLHEGASRSWVVEIAPGESYTETLVLNEWYPFSETGTYRIKIRLVRVQGSHEDLPASFGSWSALSSVEVLPRDPRRLTALCEELKTKLETSDVYEEVGEAALELSYVDDPIAVPYLQEMATLEHGMLARLAAQGLERIADNTSVDALIALSKESAVEIRSPARYSLGQLGRATKDPALKERIRQALGEQ
jgi:hypothetical protein